MMFFSEGEFSLSDNASSCVADEVVINNSSRSFLSFIGNANEAKFSLFRLPHSIDRDLSFSHSIWNSDFILEFIDVKFAGWIISEVISSELKLVIMASLEPTDHGVIISFSSHVFISPFVVF